MSCINIRVSNALPPTMARPLVIFARALLSTRDCLQGLENLSLTLLFQVYVTIAYYTVTAWKVKTFQLFTNAKIPLIPEYQNQFSSKKTNRRSTPWNPTILIFLVNFFFTVRPKYFIFCYRYTI